MTHQAIGEAMTTEIRISFKKSTDSNETIAVTLAPALSVLRSLVRCSALKAASPKRPRQESGWHNGEIATFPQAIVPS